MLLTHQYTTSSNIYLVVTRLSDGQVLDFADSTFKASGWTTPYRVFAAVRQIGSGESLYTSDLDLADVNATLAVVDIAIGVYLRIGGSPAFTTDTRLSEPFTVRVANGVDLDDLVPGNTAHVEVTANYTASDGTAFHATARLVNPDGTPVEIATMDPSATCAIDVTMDATASAGARSAVCSASTVDVGAANASDTFELQYPNPNLTAMRGYLCEATIVSAGTTYKGSCSFSTQ